MCTDVIGYGRQSCFYEDVSKSFRTGTLERELQMVHLSLVAVVSLFCESV